MEQFPKYFQKQGLGGEEDHQKFRTEGKRGRKTRFSVFEAHLEVFLLFVDIIFIGLVSA